MPGSSQVKKLLALAALALPLAACDMPTPPPPPPYHCIQSHDELDVASGLAMYAMTGSKMMGAISASKTVCTKWSDGKDHGPQVDAPVS
jgi:hypothetical protein